MNKKDYFLERKSCRKFSEKKISDEKLKDIISKAMKAPTCGNMQLYSVIVTREDESLKKLASFHFNQPASTTSPLILTICADFNRFTRWCSLKKADTCFDNFHSFITALTDAVIFAQQIVTIAELEGLATCYLGTVNYNAKEIATLLRIPELVVPVASIAIGYPEEEGEKTERLNVDAVLHEEFYRINTDSEILGFYKCQEDLPENKKFVEENGKENLAQVFSEVRYPRSTNEEVSKTFLSLLEEKGFLKSKA